MCILFAGMALSAAKEDPFAGVKTHKRFGSAIPPKPSPKMKVPKPEHCLTYDTEFSWFYNFGPMPFYGKNLTIGAEGMSIKCLSEDDVEDPPLWVLAHSGTFKRGVVERINGETGQTILGPWHLNGNDNETIESYLGFDSLVFETLDLADMTFNLEGNIQVIGRANDREGHRYHAMMYTINDLQQPSQSVPTNPPQRAGVMLGGPIYVEYPIRVPTGVAYDWRTDSYWVVDRDAEIICNMIITCCRDVANFTTARFQLRQHWVQSLEPKRCYSLEYGLMGREKNIFAKRSYKKVPTPTEPDLRMISIPAFGDPEGVAVDPVTGNLWVLNDAPTTVLYEIDPSNMEVLSFYRIQQMTGYEDANSLAVSAHHIWIGFDHLERVIVRFNRHCAYDMKDKYYYKKD